VTQSPQKWRHRDLLESRLAAIWEEVLELDAVRPDDSYFALGGNSVDALMILQKVRTEFGQNIAIREFFDAPTIGGMAATLRSRQPSQPGATSTVVQVHAGTDASLPPLFFAHAASGEMFFLRGLRSGVLPNRVCGLRSLGLDLEAPPLHTVEEMAERFGQDVQRAQPDGPILLAGYSGGGLIAFEMARQLTAAGRQVGYLGVVDAPEPQLGDKPEPDSVSTLMLQRLEFLRGMYNLPVSWNSVSEAVQEFSRAGAIGDDSTPERFERGLEIWALNMRAFYLYTPAGPFTGFAALYENEDTAAGSRIETLGEVTDTVGNAYERVWAGHLSPDTVVRRLPDNHFQVMDKPLVYELMNTDIGRALAR
jgi:thioesterase domain-containing protein/acyl carrier protein